MAAPLILVLAGLPDPDQEPQRLSRAAGRPGSSGLACAAGTCPRALLSPLGLASLCVVAGLVVAGLATGRLDREVLTQSTMSLRYRWEYWQGTWGVITGRGTRRAERLERADLLVGRRAGQFPAPYLKHKLPEASEEILDPHNMFLEVWATGGFWAVLALVAALAFGIWNLLGLRQQARAPPPRARTGRDVAARRQTERNPRVDPDDDDEEEGGPPRRHELADRLGRGRLGAGGHPRAVESVRGRTCFSRWLILGASWLAAVLLGAPLWRRLPIPALALGAAFVAVVINLLAAGGIGIPTVALGLWSMMALGLNLRDDRACGRLREYDSRMPALVLAVVWAAVLGTFVGVVGPFWRSEAAIEAAEAAINHRPPDYRARRGRLFQRHRRGSVQCPPLAEAGRVVLAGLAGAWVQGRRPALEEDPDPLPEGRERATQSGRLVAARRPGERDPTAAERGRRAA